jgi:predicted permease
MHTLRLALRPLWRNRAHSAVVVLTLAVAIGGATTMYGVVDLYWHFLPAQQQDRLVYVASIDLSPAVPEGDTGQPRRGISAPDLLDLAARTQTVAAFAGFTFGTTTLAGTGVPERLSAVRATANLPTLWNMTPASGRLFRADEGRAGAARVALLTNAFWQRRFSGAPSVLGQSLLLDGEPHTVIGVVPAALDRGVFAGTDVILPLTVTPDGSREDRQILLSGLLKPGVTREQARADLDRIARQLQTEYPRTNSHTGFVVRPLMEMLGGDTPMLLALLVVMALLLMALASANVSNVMLAAATARQREFALRTALGARRGDQLLQLLVEGLWLAVTAALLGVALAWAAVNAVRALAPAADALGALSINLRVVLAAVVMAMLAAVGFSLVPALRAVRLSAGAVSLGSSGGGEPGGARRLRQLFAAAQVALAIILVAQIAAIGRSAWSYRSRDLGFEGNGLLTFNVELARQRYADPEAIHRFATNTLVQLEAVPGVGSAAVVNRLPIAERDLDARMRLEGTAPRPEDLPTIALTKVSERYFETLRIPLLRGRGLSAADVASHRPVAVVSGAAARRYWPGADPIGARITLDASGTAEWFEIVGLVGDVRNSDANQPPALQVYIPISWAPDPALAFAVRATGSDAAQLTPAIRAAVAAVDVQEPAFAIRTMRQVVADDLSGMILITSVLIVVALISTALAAAGIYGVTSYSVARRTREIGIRTALGASPGEVVGLILAQCGRPIGVGVIAGLAAAIPLGLLGNRAIPEIDFVNPATYGAVLVGLLVVAAVATASPARRAARVDPTTALRAE